MAGRQNEDDGLERIQKIMARAGVASRRKSEELIEDGLVTVNGQVARLGDKADPDRDHIKVSGRRIEPRTRYHYLLLHKPAGVMSTRSDPEGRPTVLDLVPETYRKALVPVGRLDYATEGLLLLTDDGDFAHRVAHPRYGCTKVYEAKVKGTPDRAEIAKLLERGTVIDGRRILPVRIEPLQVPGARDATKNSWWTVEIAEGRTRQIREIFFRLGSPVQRLRRVAIGPLTDSRLPQGAVRELEESEVAMLQKATRRKKAPAKPGGRRG
jgi:23S rRNA pseudouridine2605 synthase